MSKSVKRRPLFVRLQSALEEGIQFARGTANLRITVMPSPPPEFAAEEVFQLRQRLKLSQRTFARILNVSTKTVQSWEQGSRRPSQVALRLLQLLNERPELVCNVVGITANGRQPTYKRSGQRKALGTQGKQG